MLCTQCNVVRPHSHKWCFNCGSQLRNEPTWNLCEFINREPDASYLSDLKEFVEQNPNIPYAHKMLGNMLFHNGKLVEAESHYRLALDLDPHNDDIRYDLAVVLYYQSRIGEAIRHLQTLLQNQPSFSAAHYRIGLAYFHMGEYHLAAEHLKRCTEITPDYVMARYHLGVVYASMGQYQKAMHEFSTQLDKDLRDAASRKQLQELFDMKFQNKKETNV